MSNEERFKKDIEPIMDRIKSEYDRKRAEEVTKARQPALLTSPTGGLGAEIAAMSALKYTGEWSSKTVEHYIGDVKDAIRKEGIQVTPEIETMMIDKMVQDSIPKSSIEYILSKAADNSIFLATDLTANSPLKDEIKKKAEKEYDPKYIEKVAGWTAGSAVDMIATAGLGGGLSAAKAFVAADVVVNAAIDATEQVIEKVEEKSKEKKEGKEEKVDAQNIPSVVMPEHREEWLADQQQLQHPSTENPSATISTPEPSQPTATQWQPENNLAPAAPDDTRQVDQASTNYIPMPAADNTAGWGGLWRSLGLDDLGSTLSHPGRLAANLPDMIIGLFTGRNTPAVKQNIIPLTALLVATLMSKKQHGPLRSLLLIASGLAILNKTSQQANAQTSAQGLQHTAAPQSKFRVYPEEPLNSRITEPIISGNRYVANFDGTPIAITLSDNIVEAHRQGALPLSTLSNALLAQSDRQQQLMQQNYEDGQQETYTRTLNQR